MYKGKDKKENRITSPRYELIQEIYDFSNIEFWMYSLPQFLYHSNNYLKSNIKDETIENLFQLLSPPIVKSPKEVLSFRCNDCNEIHTYHKENLNLDFECVGSDERSMGTENHYQAENYFQCECNNGIIVTYEIWEYPIGTHNYDNIEIDGGTLIKSFTPTIDFFTEEEDFVRCLECDGDNEGWGNFIDFRKKEIENKCNENINKDINKVRIGNCSWCSTLHYYCPQCKKMQTEEENKCRCNLKIEHNNGSNTYTLTDRHNI